MRESLRVLATRWRDDAAATYRSWFLWEERLKNFRSIRRGIAQVVGEIEAGTFGTVYKGSSLETVVGSIAEQRQIFKGADHAFLWKPKLPPPALAGAAGADAIALIDVLWLDVGGTVVGAFEVEHTTSIYSGIVRLLDLALGGGAPSIRGLFLVAPDDREEDVRAQLRRPAFQRVADLSVRYLAYSDLEKNRESMARFGAGMKPIEAIARTLG